MVPGSLVEMEDEKQLRVLNELFIPLSQAMPALAAAQDQEMLSNAAKAMQYIISKQIELSGASSAEDIGIIFKTGDVEVVAERDRKIQAVEDAINEMVSTTSTESEQQTLAITQLQEQMKLMAENQGLMLEKLGVPNEQSAPSSPSATPETVAEGDGVAPTT